MLSPARPMDDNVDLKRRKRSLLYLSLICFTGGAVSYLQVILPLKGIVWDIVWLILITLTEFAAEPFFKERKFIWRFSMLAIFVVFTVGMVLGLIQLGKVVGIEHRFLIPIPWLVVGLVFLLWSTFIHPDTLPQ